MTPKGIMVKITATPKDTETQHLKNISRVFNCNARMNFRACTGEKNPLENPADFPGERRVGRKHLLPFAKYIIGKQGINLKWKIQFRIA